MSKRILRDKVMGLLSGLKDSEGVPCFNKVAVFNRQFDNEEKEDTFLYPAVFFEFIDLDWETRGENLQDSTTSFRLHIAIDQNQTNNDNYDANFLDLVDKVYCLLQGADDEYYTPLRRNNETPDTDHDNVTIWMQDWVTNLHDDQANRRKKPGYTTTTASPELIINNGIPLPPSSNGLCYQIGLADINELSDCLKNLPQASKDVICGDLACGGSDDIIYDPAIYTGATISYATGDDKWSFDNGDKTYSPPSGVLAQLDNSSITPFLTLLNNNAFGNKNRFTNSLGGATYDGSGGEIIGYTIDHLTRYGITITLTNTTSWGDALNIANSSNFGGFSDWRLPDCNEIGKLLNHDPSISTLLDYSPFNINSSDAIWTSTTIQNDSTRAGVVSLQSGTQGRDIKTRQNTKLLLFRNHYS
jgi:hypothetical protein